MSSVDVMQALSGGAGDAPGLLALDFDGVICDGMEEFFETSWRSLADVAGATVPASRHAELAPRFAALRPVVESGWEMVVLLGVLAERESTEDGALRESTRWAAARDAYLRSHGLVQAAVGRAFEAVRDRWMRDDERGWRECHRLYAGIGPWLTRLAGEGRLVYVISTKGKRFVEALLAWQKVSIPPERVIGRVTPKREKWDTVRDLAATHGLRAGGGDIWFVEDRLTTLIDFRHAAPDLPRARLFLADWGYIFPERDPDEARTAGIPVLTLAQMTGPFEGWPSA